MRVHCNFCPEGSETTDNVKLVTIGRRDYIICKDCSNGRNRYAQSNRDRAVPRIQEGDAAAGSRA